MKVAVAGATGLVGAFVVDALRRGGHESVPLAPSHGVDLVDGSGIDGALDGVDAVIDVTNTGATDPDEAVAFFSAVGSTLLAAGRRAGVRHHVALSIVGVGDLSGNGHYDGKRAQERLVETGPLPFTIQRAAEFHEYARMALEWTTENGRATVAPLSLQPVAARDVGDALAAVAVGPPQGRATDLAGPDRLDLVDMVRRVVAARGETTEVVSSWADGALGTDLAAQDFLPDDGARIAPTTFETWLAGVRDAARARTDPRL